MCFRDGLLSNNIRGCLWGQGTFYKKNCDIINRASLVAQLAKPPAMQETLCWKRHRLPTPVFLGFPGGFAGEESACNVRHLGLFPGLGRFPGEGNCYPLQYCGLENSMDCIVYGVTWLSDFHFNENMSVIESTDFWVKLLDIILASTWATVRTWVFVSLCPWSYN